MDKITNLADFNVFVVQYEHYKRNDGLHPMVKCLSAGVVNILQMELDVPNLYLSEYCEDSVLMKKIMTFFPPTSKFMVAEAIDEIKMDQKLCVQYNP